MVDCHASNNDGGSRLQQAARSRRNKSKRPQQRNEPKSPTKQDGRISTVRSSTTSKRIVPPGSPADTIATMDSVDDDLEVTIEQYKRDESKSFHSRATELRRQRRSTRKQGPSSLQKYSPSDKEDAPTVTSSDNKSTNSFSADATLFLCGGSWLDYGALWEESNFCFQDSIGLATADTFTTLESDQFTHGSDVDDETTLESMTTNAKNRQLCQSLLRNKTSKTLAIANNSLAATSIAGKSSKSRRSSKRGYGNDHHPWIETGSTNGSGDESDDESDESDNESDDESDDESDHESYDDESDAESDDDESDAEEASVADSYSTIESDEEYSIYRGGATGTLDIVGNHNDQDDPSIAGQTAAESAFQSDITKRIQDELMSARESMQIEGSSNNDERHLPLGSDHDDAGLQSMLHELEVDTYLNKCDSPTEKPNYILPTDEGNEEVVSSKPTAADESTPDKDDGNAGDKSTSSTELDSDFSSIQKSWSEEADLQPDDIPFDRSTITVSPLDETSQVSQQESPQKGNVDSCPEEKQSTETALEDEDTFMIDLLEAPESPTIRNKLNAIVAKPTNDASTMEDKHECDVGEPFDEIDVCDRPFPKITSQGFGSPDTQHLFSLIQLPELLTEDEPLPATDGNQVPIISDTASPDPPTEVIAANVDKNNDQRADIGATSAPISMPSQECQAQTCETSDYGNEGKSLPDKEKGCKTENVTQCQVDVLSVSLKDTNRETNEEQPNASHPQPRLKSANEKAAIQRRRRISIFSRGYARRLNTGTADVASNTKNPVDTNESDSYGQVDAQCNTKVTGGGDALNATKTQDTTPSAQSNASIPSVTNKPNLTTSRHSRLRERKNYLQGRLGI